MAAEALLRVLGYGPAYVNPIASFHRHDPQLGLSGKPGMTARFAQPEFDVQVALDEQGFRRVEQADHAADAPRLFVLGDSFAWGWGVAQGQTFADLLARRLPDHAVANLGLSGTGTVIARLLVDRHVLPLLRPGDTVLVTFFHNDLDDNIGRNHRRWAHARVVDGEVRVLPPAPPHFGSRLKSLIKDHSYLGNLVALIIDRYQLERRQRRQLAAAERGSPADQDPATRSGALPDDDERSVVLRHCLRSIREAVADRGGRTLFAVIPGRELYGEGPATAAGLATARTAHLTALRAGADVGLPTLDLLPAFERARARSATPLTFALDAHWNVDGHRVAADRLASFLRDGR